jgi:hypothetical protein
MADKTVTIFLLHWFASSCFISNIRTGDKPCTREKGQDSDFDKQNVMTPHNNDNNNNNNNWTRIWFIYKIKYINIDVAYQIRTLEVADHCRTELRTIEVVDHFRTSDTYSGSGGTLQYIRYVPSNWRIILIRVWSVKKLIIILIQFKFGHFLA